MGRLGQAHFKIYLAQLWPTQISEQKKMKKIIVPFQNEHCGLHRITESKQFDRILFPLNRFKTSHLLRYKDKQYDAGPCAREILVVKTPSMDQKNVNFLRKLGYRVQKNFINYSSISENTVFDD